MECLLDQFRDAAGKFIEVHHIRPLAELKSAQRTTLAVLTPAGRRLAAKATEAVGKVRFGLDLGDARTEQLVALLTELRAEAGDFDLSASALSKGTFHVQLHRSGTRLIVEVEAKAESASASAAWRTPRWTASPPTPARPSPKPRRRVRTWS